MTDHSSSSLPQQEDGDSDYIFGFGSIINVATHAPWISSGDAAGECSSASSLPGRPAVVSARMGYQRGWNFRSNTGFTALGIRRVVVNTSATTEDADSALPAAEEQVASDINGVLFRIRHSVLADFDRREVGYDRVQIPFDCIDFPPLTEAVECIDNIPSDARLWVYVPRDVLPADEDHPVLQSYVDTVMQGCLFWGGEAMAETFVRTTTDWSVYFLNDTPSSRRPWLYRQQYTVIDKILQRNNSVTHYSDRRHPEEFASAFLMKSMRGAWSVPRRNKVFTGRDRELGQIHARLTEQRRSGDFTVAKLEVAGMGGVGKTQLCTEYCYRYFPSYYGLVIWLQATSAESVVAGYRQLMADTCGGSLDALQDKDTDEIVAEVKARLFRSTVPWLLVFDNLEDHSLLDKFVPNGGSAGHVLVTTRLVRTDIVDFLHEEDQTMLLGCFNPDESVELLCRAAGGRNICADLSMHLSAAKMLAEHLGHLPLALGMAAAYMRKCDVDCSEYLTRYYKYDASTASSTGGSQLHLGHEAVSSSLALSLEAIKTENPIAWEALRLLGWVGADQITKKLLRDLFAAKIARDREDARTGAEARNRQNVRNRSLSRLLPGLVGGLAIASLLKFSRQPSSSSSRSLGLALSAASIVASTVAASWIETESSKENGQETSFVHLRQGSNISADVYEDTDITWTMLKSFSLLVVKEGQGSIHRLLAQALRVNQSVYERRYYLDICLHAVMNSWTFKAEKTDTWQESASVLEHVKTVVVHTVDQHAWSLDTAALSRETGVFSAMALNRFEEAQVSLEQSLKILDGLEQGNHSSTDLLAARAATLHQYGRVLRYEGSFSKAEEALKGALEIRNRLDSRHDVAESFHELGILEVRKHNLDSAAEFLQQALSLRRILERESPSKDTEAHCASTLHQLATVYVARKPPCLDEAESFLTEALSLDMQIGQRAATLKQLARVAIRRGNFSIAERRLDQALELYSELYGENTHHINVAAVKFQQGILAFQQEQYDEAWENFSECLRTRRIVYAYSQGNHIEVSSAYHELARVAFAQGLLEVACEMLKAERTILDQLLETSSERARLLQALLTNLTWLRKCAKEKGDEEEARRLTLERSEMKRREKSESSAKTARMSDHHVCSLDLQNEALRCRLIARQFALAKPPSRQRLQGELEFLLQSLADEIEHSPVCSMQRAAVEFYQMITFGLSKDDNAKETTANVLKACDCLRGRLREHGVQVKDSVHGVHQQPPTTNAP